MEGEGAANAVLLFAVTAAQLQQRLCVGCARGFYSLLAPSLYDAVLLRFNLVQQVLGHSAESLLFTALAINVQHGNNGIYYYDIHLFLSHASVAGCLSSAKTGVILPIAIQ